MPCDHALCVEQNLNLLRQRGVFFGTSSWKYEGWKGLVYKKAYPSTKAFERECLTEYALHYPTVGVDHTYYAWPSEKTFQTYMEQTAAPFCFVPKVTERITVFRFPNLPRYGKDAGKLNPDFLSEPLFFEKFLSPLEPYSSRLGPMVFEFSQFYPGQLKSGSDFVERLRSFFGALREKTDLDFAVEMRNQNWLEAPYFQALQDFRVGHVFNSWTRMPSVVEQMQKASGFDLPHIVARILLQPGVKYEQAVEAYSPYDKIQNPQPALREATADLAELALRQKKRAYILVNNRAEGCAPITIQSVVDILEKRGDLEA